MFPGGFGRPPPGHEEDDEDDEDEGEMLDEEQIRAAAAMMAQVQAAQGGQDGGAPPNMNELLAMLTGGGSGGGGTGLASTGGRAVITEVDDEDDIDEDDLDETLTERLVGLTEMFPERVRWLLSGLVSGSIRTAKWTWQNGQALAWVVTSSALIGIMPVVLERERYQFQQEQLSQQRQMLLGPGANPGQAGHSMFGGLAPPGLK